MKVRYIGEMSIVAVPDFNLAFGIKGCKDPDYPNVVEMDSKIAKILTTESPHLYRIVKEKKSRKSRKKK